MIDQSIARLMAEPNTILRGVVGSTVHGLAVADQDDRDEMGICVEPVAHYFGLRERFEQWVYRTKPEGERSGPGDLDLTVYSLAKWAKLALAGNPTIMLLLFVPEKHLSVCEPWGKSLRRMADAFISAPMIDRYLGYMREQRERLVDLRRMPKRPELIDLYGYDTKYAGHVLRLGYQGIELATTGKLILPMQKAPRERILAVRTGRVSKQEVLEEAADLEAHLVRLREGTSLGEPDTARVERFVLDAYRGMAGW